MSDMMNLIGKYSLVPVVVLEDAKDAVPLAEALIRGGLPCAEVTFRTAAAEESIRKMSVRGFPGNADRCGNSSYHRAGGSCCGSRSQIYRKSRL